jgi:hypothetical protein
MPKSVILSVPVGGQQEVARLHVAVDDPGLVRGVQRAGALGGDVGDQIGRREPRSTHELLEVGALDQLHHQEHVIARSAHVVRRNHVRMGQPRRSLRLRLEALHRVHGVAVETPEKLDRHLPGEDGVLGLPDLTCTAPAEQGHQPVPTCQYLAVHKPHLPQWTATLRREARMIESAAETLRKPSGTSADCDRSTTVCRMKRSIPALVAAALVAATLTTSTASATPVRHPSRW